MGKRLPIIAKVAREIETIWAANRRTAVLITNDVDETLVLADRIILLNPDGTLGQAFPVTLPRPRDRAAMNDDPAFKTLRADVTADLMDVGIAAKVAETRMLPVVTPHHAMPKACAAAAASRTDRVGMMTNGPNATIGRITELKLPRPRTRRALLATPTATTTAPKCWRFWRNTTTGRRKRRWRDGLFGGQPGSFWERPEGGSNSLFKTGFCRGKGQEGFLRDAERCGSPQDILPTHQEGKRGRMAAEVHSPDCPKKIFIGPFRGIFVWNTKLSFKIFGQHIALPVGRWLSAAI